MNTCKTCKWWDFKEGPWVPNDTHPCLKMAHNGDYPEHQDTLANAFCVDECDGMVFTNAKFGCVLWEAKE